MLHFLTFFGRLAGDLSNSTLNKKEPYNINFISFIYNRNSWKHNGLFYFYKKLPNVRDLSI